MMPKRLLLIIILIFVICACSSIAHKETIFVTSDRYKPYEGSVEVHYGINKIDEFKSKYVFIATISARTAWCNIISASDNKDIHDYIVKQAAHIGGNRLIIHCGGTPMSADCTCNGEVFR